LPQVLSSQFECLSAIELIKEFNEFVLSYSYTGLYSLYKPIGTPEEKDELVRWLNAFQQRHSGTEETSAHVKRVTVRAEMFASLLNLNVKSVRLGALLHDIGKVAIPKEVLTKPGKLDMNEWNLMRKHVTIGEDFLLEFPMLATDPVLRGIVRHHHEHWDGSGYPDRLTREAIPIEARLFALVDVYDAMRFPRIYRPQGISSETIYEYLQEEAGKHFDPELTNQFLEIERWVGSLVA